MNLVLFPLAAMAGGVVGIVLHEALHALAATQFGELEAVGWQGGLTGGPYVDFRTDSWLASEVVRKLPLVVGVAGLALTIATAEASVSWVFNAGAVAGLLWTSPEDLSQSASVESATSE